MNKDDYVSLLEVRCKIHTDTNFVPRYGERQGHIFVPANCGEKVFFKIVVPDFDVPKAELTGSRVYVAKVWDGVKKTMVDISDEIGVGKCLDSQMSDSVGEIVKSCMDLTKPEGSKERYLPWNRSRNIIIGMPRPIIGVYVRLDSKEVYNRLKEFDVGGRNHWDYHSLHIWEKEDECGGYIPVENILGYETPKRFAERKDGFTGEMLVDWPPTVEWVNNITEHLKKKTANSR
jgi:hypothetical protein